MEGKKGLIVIIILLLLISLGLGGYIAYDKIMTKPKEETLTKIDDVNIDLTVFYQISETLMKFDNAFNDPRTNYFAYIYKQKKLEAKDFDLGAAVYASIRSDFKESNLLLYVPESIAKNSFTKIFGDNLKYQTATLNSGEYLKTAYDGNLVSYAYIEPVDSNVYPSEYMAINTKTILKDNKVIVTRKIVFVEYIIQPGTNIASNIILYKDETKQNKIGDIALKNGKVSPKEIVSKYGSKLATFNYTFKQNESLDYSFSSIEKTQ